jgi:hypothetical protein
MDVNLESVMGKLYHSFNKFIIIFTVSAQQPGISSMKIVLLPTEKNHVQQFP